jgi:hypothetical protein
MSTFPVFSDDDGDVRQETARTPDGFQPRGQMPATDSEFFHFRDRAREAEEKAAKTDELFRQADPALHAARATLLRTMRTVSHYLDAVRDLQVAISQKANQMNSTSAGSALGTRTERAYELNALRSQLVDVEQEYAAAVEEFEAAKAAVEALTVQP